MKTNLMLLAILILSIVPAHGEESPPIPMDLVIRLGVLAGSYSQLSPVNDMTGGFWIDAGVVAQNGVGVSGIYSYQQGTDNGQSGTSSTTTSATSSE